MQRSDEYIEDSSGHEDVALLGYGDELPTFWDELACALAEPVWFASLWCHDQFEVRRLWAALEANSSHRMLRTYTQEIEHPELSDAFGPGLATLLRSAGHRQQSRSITDYRLVQARASGEPPRIQEALGDAAEVADSAHALKLLEERERICRTLDYSHGLQEALGEQVLRRWIRSVIESSHSHAARTMAISSEQHRICRLTNDRLGLQKWMETHAFLVQVDGPVEIAIRVLRNREKLCRELNELDGLWESLGQLSLFFIEVGDLQHARDCALECEQICRQLGCWPGLQAALGHLGWLAIMARNTEDARSLYAEQSEIRQTLGWPSNLEWQLERMYRYRRPVPLPDVCETAEHVARDLDDEEALQAALGWSACLCLDSNPERAIVQCIEREAICSRVGNPLSLSEAIQTRAVALLHLDRDAEALQAYVELERLARTDAGEHEYRASSVEKALKGQQQALERLLHHCCRPDSALHLFAEQERVARELSDRRGVTRARRNRRWAEQLVSRRARPSDRDPGRLPSEL
jgi:tetratricopeptide (TPR) repeat protein